MNRAVLMGRLTRDPELRTTGSGTPVCTFTLAVDRDYSGGDKKTDFIPCVAWRDTAEFVNRNFFKGKMAAAVGSIQIREWTGKDGEKHKDAELVVQSIYFCGDKTERPAETYEQPKFEDLDEEDLPF